MKKGHIFLIPSAIAPNSKNQILTRQLEEVLQSTRYFIVEHAREARRFISSLKLGIVIEELSFSELDKKKQEINIGQLLKPALAGENIGVLSDAGCPGVADPGAEVVKLAHELGLKVIPLVGPSSILLALMGSGMSGQNFRFNGYLPIDNKELISKLKDLESHSRRHNETQIFIETPYRSDKILAVLKNNLALSTRLAVAINLNANDELINSMLIEKWKNHKLIIGKTPTVFLFQS